MQVSRKRRKGVFSLREQTLRLVCFIGFCVAGAYLGTVFSLPISGYLCQTNIMGGWPSVFYLFGECPFSACLRMKRDQENPVP